MNLQLVTTSPVDERGQFVVQTTAMTFGAEHRDGGFVTRIRYGSGGYTSIEARHVSGSPAERAAAQAVQDAVRATGLLGQVVPGVVGGYPKPGVSRLFFDRRQWMIEYPTAAPTSQVQAVLDAISAWSQLR